MSFLDHPHPGAPTVPKRRLDMVLPRPSPIRGRAVAAGEAADTPRVFEHALNDAVGALAVLGDLVEVAAEHPDDLVDLGTPLVAERRQGRGRRLRQFLQQFAR